MNTTALASPMTAPARSRSERVAMHRELASLAPLLTGTLVCALVMLAIGFSRAGGTVAALWGAAGLGAAMWLRAKPTLSFDAAFGATLAAAFGIGNLMSGNSVAMSAMFTIVDTAEVALAVWLMRRFAPRFDIATVKGLSTFWLLACVCGAGGGMALAALGLQLLGRGEFMAVFPMLWFGHALGLAVIGPFVLSLTPAKLAPFRSFSRAFETVALLVGVGVVAGLVFSSVQPITFLLVPLLILTAVRLRIVGATAALVIVAVIAVVASRLGLGPYAATAEGVAQAVERAQLFVLFGCLPTLLVAALLDERDRFAALCKLDAARAEAASEGKSRLLANVSHEIKSPVAGIIGIGELWSSGKLGDITPTQLEMAEVLVRTAQQVEALAHDLLDVARAESGSIAVNLRPVDVGSVVEDVSRAVAMRPEGQTLRFEIDRPAERTVVRADSVRLSQILTNLAVNAVKYGRSGGVVTFRLSRTEAGLGRVEVVDRGPGITVEKQGQLFEPFNRLGMERSAIEGHGIGLALAKRLTELQGGRIGVDSAPGQGASFWVDLPLAA